LRRTAADATKRPKDRQAEMLREIVGLIESATKRAKRMEGNGNNGVRIGEDVAARVA
jgi:hypothetical protein